MVDQPHPCVLRLLPHTYQLRVDQVEEFSAVRGGRLFVLGAADENRWGRPRRILAKRSASVVDGTA